MSKKVKPKRCGIEITSFTFCGALNAEHYYGEVWWPTPRAKYSTGKEKLTQPMTSKMAAYLNKKDDSFGSRYGYKRGDLTERFDTREQVNAAGIKFLTEKFGENITIEEGSSCYAPGENDIIWTK